MCLKLEFLYQNMNIPENGRTLQLHLADQFNVLEVLLRLDRLVHIHQEDFQVALDETFIHDYNSYQNLPINAVKFSSIFLLRGGLSVTYWNWNPKWRESMKNPRQSWLMDFLLPASLKPNFRQFRLYFRGGKCNLNSTHNSPRTPL